MKAYGLFDKEGQFIIAYPRKVMTECYLCNFSRASGYSILPINITVKQPKKGK